MKFLDLTIPLGVAHKNPGVDMVGAGITDGAG